MKLEEGAFGLSEEIGNVVTIAGIILLVIILCCCIGMIAMCYCWKKRKNNMDDGVDEVNQDDAASMISAGCDGMVTEGGIMTAGNVHTANNGYGKTSIMEDEDGESNEDEL